MGLVRRETVRILSFSGVKNCEDDSFVREDRESRTSDVSVVLPKALLSSYVRTGELLKASQVGNQPLNKFFFRRRLLRDRRGVYLS